MPQPAAPLVAGSRAAPGLADITADQLDALTYGRGLDSHPLPRGDRLSPAATAAARRWTTSRPPVPPARSTPTGWVLPSTPTGSAAGWTCVLGRGDTARG